MLLPAAAFWPLASRAASAPAWFERRCAAIERASGGVLGVCVLDTATGLQAGYRADQRFLMCSTFKMLASALVLHRVDRGAESLERRIAFGQADLAPYSPVTGPHAGGDMSVGELCAAAITHSDNTAANLVLASYGGPAALTAFARSLGDTVTRLDRIEPALDGWDGVKDTTSPRAMTQTLRKVALGEALSAGSREVLQGWLRANTTGARRLQAGIPADWRIGDKTGAADGRDGGTTNDIALVWPPGRSPLVVSAYLTRSRTAFEARDATLAAVGQLLPLFVRSTATMPKR